MTREAFATEERYVRDWLRYPELRILNRFNAIAPVSLLLALLAAGELLAAVAPGLGTNGPQLVVWGFFVSTVVLFHATFTINSLAHRLGSRRYATTDDSRNNLFALFLDDTLTYSCGVFERPGASMREASVAKLDLVCRKLDLRPEHHVLEIGTGWGSFALHAAGRYGCRVTTTTISPAQHDLAARRVGAAGLEGRVRGLRRDYRDLEGTFDRLVSIEMIEAVGHEHLDAYVATCAARLAPGGAALLQAIVMPDEGYDRYLRNVDLIQRHVFPGSCLPCVATIRSAAERTDLRIADLDDLTPHYVPTLRSWRERFLSNVGEVRRLGYPERFVRLWDFYLAYCEAGFAERYIGDVQVLLAKPAWSPPEAGLPHGAPAVGVAA